MSSSSKSKKGEKCEGSGRLAQEAGSYFRERVSSFSLDF